MPTKMTDDQARDSLRRRLLAHKRATASGCWEWTKARSADGYGLIGTTRAGPSRCLRTHRAAYEVFVGPVPEGLVLDHLCRNRACHNPDHLEPVPQRENVVRGASPVAAYVKRESCEEGHPLTGGNLYVRTDGGRRCRTCRDEYAAKWRAARVAGG